LSWRVSGSQEYTYDDGPLRSTWRAKILAWAGEKDQALAEFSRLLHVPYGTNVYGDRFDPGWLPLRDDPRFKALLVDPKNNEPIDWAQGISAP